MLLRAFRESATARKSATSRGSLIRRFNSADWHMEKIEVFAEPEKTVVRSNAIILEWIILGVRKIFTGADFSS